jgi:hypothetical protein
MRPLQLFTWHRELRYAAEAAAPPPFVPAVVEPVRSASLRFLLRRPSVGRLVAREGLAAALELDIDGVSAKIARGADVQLAEKTISRKKLTTRSAAPIPATSARVAPAARTASVLPLMSAAAIKSWMPEACARRRLLIRSSRVRRWPHSTNCGTASMIAPRAPTIEDRRPEFSMRAKKRDHIVACRVFNR